MANHYTKQALKQGGLALVTLLLGVIFIVVGIVRLYDYRNHVVSEVRVTLNSASPQRMFLDEGFETLVASGTLSADERDKAIPTENQGQGQYYHPSKPVWVGKDWTFPQTQLYWIEALDEATGVNFTGGPLDPSILPVQISPDDYVDGYRFSLYTLPCDVPFDEVLVGMSVVLFVRSGVHVILFLHLWSKHSALELYNSEKKVPKDTKFILRVLRARRLLTYALGIFAVALSILYLNSETCERDAPELFLTVLLFLLSLWLGLIAYGVARVVSSIFADSDPGPCPACDGRRSSTSLLLPCGHDVKYCYEDAVETLLDNPCPVCTRLIRDVKLVRRGRISAVAMAIIALLQMITPFFEAYWNLWTTQCFIRDPPYTLYAKGCQLGQGLAIIMIVNGFLGVLVADAHGRNRTVSKIYRTINYATLVYCLFQAIVFQAAVSGRLMRPLSKASVTELRENGATFDELREQNYHFWSLLAGDCSLESQGSLTAQWYSCRPCDKTEPSSCRGELQYTENMRLSAQAAMAYLADAVFAGVVIMLYRGLERTNARMDREAQAVAELEFKQMLEEEVDIDEHTDPRGLAAIEEDLARARELRGWRLVRQTLRDVGRGLCSKFVVHSGGKRFVQSQEEDTDMAKGSAAKKAPSECVSGSGNPPPPAAVHRRADARHSPALSDTSSSDSDDFSEKAGAYGGVRRRRTKRTSATVNETRKEFSAVNASNIETQTRGYAVPARSTWESRMKNDERFHPLTLSPESRTALFKEYQAEVKARKAHKGRWD